VQDFLADAAREFGLWIVGGTLPLESTDAEHVFNSSHRLVADGRVRWRATTRSTCSASTTARDRFDEARTIEPGSEPVAFDLVARDGRSAGASACRCATTCAFPELYRRLGADLLLVPSAFTHVTGQAHWETLLRARAIENLAYVCRARAGRPARERPPHLGP
jgi:predicted amidohydrolase